VLSALRLRCRRHQTALTVAASIAASLALGVVLITKWDELKTGITGAPIATAAAAVGLQLLALVSRSEAWHQCVRASGGTVGRRTLFRASSMGFVGGLLHTQLGTAARIAALRRSAPEASPRVTALLGAELPILIVEAGLAALTSFTLVGPLGLPWWIPFVALAAVFGATMALRSVAAAGARWLRSGLAVLRTLDGRARLVGFVLIAVLAQIGRNWLLLHAVGVDASLFDAIAVLIAVVTLGQLPFGLSVGAAASVLILGPQGVAAAAAAGVLLTATGTVGGLCFAAWGFLDMALCRPGALAGARRCWSSVAELAGPAYWPGVHAAAMAAQLRRSVERICFDLVGHMQIGPIFLPASAAGPAPSTTPNSTDPPFATPAATPARPREPTYSALPAITAERVGYPSTSRANLSR